MKKYKLESDYQAHVIDRLENEFPGSIVGKVDYRQGIPDLQILYKNKWAALECKKSANESHQPNQDHYVEQMNKMSFASFIYPENEEEVFDALSKSFGVRRNTRSI